VVTNRGRKLLIPQTVCAKDDGPLTIPCFISRQNSTGCDNPSVCCWGSVTGKNASLTAQNCNSAVLQCSQHKPTHLSFIKIHVNPLKHIGNYVYHQI
jgi:hypothetical protein